MQRAYKHFQGSLPQGYPFIHEREASYKSKPTTQTSLKMSGFSKSLADAKKNLKDKEAGSTEPGVLYPAFNLLSHMKN
jgi:hypothetical protein